MDLGDGSGGYAGDTSFVTSVTSTNIACVTAAPTDAIETVVSGGTSLRWDDVTNQFIFNWKTPKTPGACLLLTVTLTDGTTHSASFKADVAKSRRSLAK